MARLAVGYLYHSGELIQPKTTGFGISCLSAVKPYFNGKPELVHPGRGERMLAYTEESAMFFTFPAKHCYSLLGGLKKTHEKEIRYPVQRYLMYQPPTVKPMENLAETLHD